MCPITHLKQILNGIQLKMKCLLLLLASGLVTSDKLDRTYLPPARAKYSGGTLDDLYPPLEFSKENYLGTIKNVSSAGFYPNKNGVQTNQYFGNRISTVPINPPASMFPDSLTQTTPLTTNQYQSTIPTARPSSNVYGRAPPKSPSASYLPSKKTTMGTQSYLAHNINPEIQRISTTNDFIPEVDYISKEYYYVPAMQPYKTFANNQRYNADGSPVLGSMQNPNKKINSDVIDNEGYMPTMANLNDIGQNYQPNSFGYYGGNPMIITSQSQIPQNIELTSKFAIDENNVPVSSKKEYLNDDKKTLVQPLVSIDSISNPKLTNSKTTMVASNILAPRLSPATNSLFSDNKVSSVFDQKEKNLARPRLRQKRPQTEKEKNAVIVNYENTISAEGYSYSYDTSNGIHADESGVATNGVRAKGSYSYTGDDGKIYSVFYTADENGFQPRGDHLPKAPSIPEAIQKIIEQAARDEAAGLTDDGSYDEKKYGYMKYQGAMERYNEYQNSRDKISRPKTTRRKQIGSNHNNNINQIKNSPNYNNNAMNINKRVIDSLNLPNFNINDKNKLITKEHKPIYSSNMISRPNSDFEITNQNPEQQSDSNRRPINSVIDNQILNDERNTFEPQNMNVDIEPAKTVVGISAHNIQGQVKTPSRSGATITDDGYYYVPPIIKLNTSTEETIYKKDSYFTTSDTPKTIVTEANKRTEFDEPQKNKNVADNGTITQFPLNQNTMYMKTTRQPYISGPDDREKAAYDNSQSNISPKIIDDNGIVTYPNSFDSSMYRVNTTPMTAQTVQTNQYPDELSQYYQYTTNPSIFDETHPDSIANKVNIPSMNPGITFQDFVTTTFRPSTSISSDDGVLEVNQNVKIYGLRKPETTFGGISYPKQDLGNKKRIYYPSTNEEMTFSGYSYSNPMQDSAIQGFPNKNTPHSNEYITTGFPAAEPSIAAGQYPGANYGRLSQALPSTASLNPIFNENILGNPTQPGQEVTTATTLCQGPGGGVIGEDFSGPKQPQKYDQETGYYYK